MEVLWHSPDGMLKISILNMGLRIINLRLQLHFPVRVNELMGVTDLFTYIIQVALLSMVQS